MRLETGKQRRGHRDQTLQFGKSTRRMEAGNQRRWEAQWFRNICGFSSTSLTASGYLDWNGKGGLFSLSPARAPIYKSRNWAKYLARICVKSLSQNLIKGWQTHGIEVSLSELKFPDMVKAHFASLLSGCFLKSSWENVWLLEWLGGWWNKWTLWLCPLSEGRCPCWGIEQTKSETGSRSEH